MLYRGAQVESFRDGSNVVTDVFFWNSHGIEKIEWKKAGELSLMMNSIVTMVDMMTIVNKGGLFIVVLPHPLELPFNAM